MTTEEKIQKIKTLWDEVEKYSDGLPKEERSAARNVGFYDCLCRSADNMEATKKEVAIAFLNWFREPRYGFVEGLSLLPELPTTSEGLYDLFIEQTKLSNQ